MPRGESRNPNQPHGNPIWKAEVGNFSKLRSVISASLKYPVPTYYRHDCFSHRPAQIIEMIAGDVHRLMDRDNKPSLPKASGLIAGDRRDNRRYAIELQLTYQVLHRKRVLEAGQGRTVDFSSGGILFEAETPLPAGTTVKLAIAWPVLLHNVVPMRLLVTGQIVRSHGSRVAIRTTRHEFRTQGRQDSSNGAPFLPLVSAAPAIDKGWK